MIHKNMTTDCICQKYFRKFVIQDVTAKDKFNKYNTRAFAKKCCLLPSLLPIARFPGNLLSRTKYSIQYT